MAKVNKPRAGSLQYVPRKRSKMERPRIQSWPQSEEVKALGYTVYKAGMTHVIAVDETKNSPTNGLEVALPVTILEAPPMKVLGVRVYRKGYEGMEAVSDIWLDSEGGKDKKSAKKDPSKKIEAISGKLDEVSDIRLIVSTQPSKTNMPKKRQDVMEVAIGGDMPGKLEYAKELLGKEIKITDVFNENDFVDVTSVTKGKGFQGVIKRYGIKKQRAKATKKTRHMGTGGAWSPSKKLWMEPQPGQVGYHKRTEFNKLILKIGEDGKEVTPAGGFLRYGPVSGDYLMVYGSIPGPVKRIIRLTRPRRPHSEVNYTLKRIDLSSKQGM
ncbi:MAG: 50S ribosomal protein L3 [Candidatus Altiarchaeota archaeon]